MSIASVDTNTRSDISVKFSKNWQVIFFNDDTTPELLVVEILVKIFKYSMDDAFVVTKHIEKAGSAVVAVLPKKLAEVRVKKTKDLTERVGYGDFRVEIKEED